MFDSGISASSLIAGLKNEIDVAIPISNRSYVDSLNSLEQLLYTEIIKEQKSIDSEYLGTIDLSLLQVGTGEKNIVFEDIYAVRALASVYGDRDVMLKKSTLLTGATLPNCWYRENNNLNCNIKKYDSKMYDTDNAVPFDDSYFTFTPINNGAEYAVSARDGLVSGDLVIPYEHNGKPVTEISDFAFTGRLDARSIIIPNTVKHIGCKAFYGAVRNFYVPSSVTSMDNEALCYMEIVYGSTVQRTYISIRCKKGCYAETYCANHNPVIGCTAIPEQVRIYYFVRPVLKTVDANDVVGAGNVMLPVEFIDLAKAKLRGDAYKIANEDALAAKWLNDYNVLLETFKEWVEQKRPHFGM